MKRMEAAAAAETSGWVGIAIASLDIIAIC